MTTSDDWKFRAGTLRAAAQTMRDRAGDLLTSAEALMKQAERCDVESLRQTPQEPASE